MEAPAQTREPGFVHGVEGQSERNVFARRVSGSVKSKGEKKGTGKKKKKKGGKK